MKHQYDLIVVGAGPAGSSCAERAARLGLSTLLLERNERPGGKPCASGLTSRALALMGGGRMGIEHRRFTKASVDFGGNLLLTISSDTVLVATTTRGELDSELLGDAARAGAGVETGREVTALEEEGAGVRVRAGSDSWFAGHAVLADGARGAGRRSLRLEPVAMGGGLYVRAFPSSSGQLEPFSDRVWFDPTATRRGYGWIFPKRDHLNVGVFSQRPLAGDYATDLAEFMRAHRLHGWSVERRLAFPIPVRRPADALGAGRVLAAGDAAGLVDPTTGEGIAWAIASGRAAAESVAEAIEERRDDGGALARYSALMTATLRAVDSSRGKGDFVYGLGPATLRWISGTPLLRTLVAPLWRAASRGGAGAPALSITVERSPQ